MLLVWVFSWNRYKKKCQPYPLRIIFISLRTLQITVISSDFTLQSLYLHFSHFAEALIIHLHRHKAVNGHVQWRLLWGLNVWSLSHRTEQSLQASLQPVRQQDNCGCNLWLSFIFSGITQSVSGKEPYFRKTGKEVYKSSTALSNGFRWTTELSPLNTLWDQIQ